MRRLAFSAFFALTIVATSIGVGVAAPPSNMTGTWVVQQTGANGNSTTQITLSQSGNQLVGTSATTRTDSPANSSTTRRSTANGTGPAAPAG